MSVKLKDRRKAPCGGFQFTQAETGWDLAKANPAAQWDFNLAVREMIRHRVANPRFNLATNPDAVANELDTTNAMRMLTIKGAQGFVTETTGMPTFPKSQALAAIIDRAAAGAGAARRLGSGAALQLDWLGDGGDPCPKEEAEARASVCATYQSSPDAKPGCKWNEKGDWTRYFTLPVSNAIKRELERKHHMKLETAHDDKLHICTLCSCPLSLKMWTPMPYIQAHMPQAVKDDLRQNAPWCWIVK